MKAKLYVCIILTALIAVFTVSGCNNKALEIEPVATMSDATVDEVVISSVTEPTPASTVAITVATTAGAVGETTTAPKATTKAEEVTEAIEVNNQTSDKVTASNTDKTENKTSESTQKPNNTSGNANSNTTSNTTTKKPSNTEKPKPVETQPPATEAPVVITDDTPLTFEQMNTEEMMQRMVDDTNAYFETLGMTYDESLDPSWSGWFYGWQGGYEHTAVRSYKTNSEYNIIGIREQVDAIFIEYRGNEYTDYRFKTTYELTDRGTYSIIFCYG